MMKPVIADTGPLYALADQDDRWHEQVSAYFSSLTTQVIVPVTVLPEVCYLIGTHLGAHAEVQFVQAVVKGEIQVEFLKKEDLARAGELAEKYLDAEIGFVDASIVAVAERLQIKEILTTDRRHFSMIRPRHCTHFVLRP